MREVKMITAINPSSHTAYHPKVQTASRVRFSAERNIKPDVNFKATANASAVVRDSLLGMGCTAYALYQSAVLESVLGSILAFLGAVLIARTTIVKVAKTGL